MIAKISKSLRNWNALYGGSKHAVLTEKIWYYWGHLTETFKGRGSMRMAHCESTVVHNLAKKTILHTFFNWSNLRKPSGIIKILVRNQPGWPAGFRLRLTQPIGWFFPNLKKVNFLKQTLNLIIAGYVVGAWKKEAGSLKCEWFLQRGQNEVFVKRDMGQPMRSSATSTSSQSVSCLGRSRRFHPKQFKTTFYFPTIMECRLRLSGREVAEFINTDWGDKVNSGIGLSYRSARLYGLASR